jgi:predicted Zn-dependent protease
MTVEENSDVLLHQGMELHRAGRFGDAETAYLAVIRQRPNDGQAINLLGALYLTGEKPREAAKWLARRLRSAPDDDLARLNLGKAWLAAGEVAKSVRVLSPLVEKNPGNADAVISLAKAEQLRGKFDKAGELLESLARRYPAEALVHAEHANHLLLTGDRAGAAACFRQAVAAAPRDIRHLCNLAATLQGMYRLDEAAATLRDAAAIDPADYQLRFLAAMNDALAGRFAEAADAMAGLVAERPDDIAAQANLADILSFDNRTEEAVERLESVIAGGVNHPDIWHNYGVLLLQLGRLAEAEEAHRRSLRLKPESGAGWRHLAELKKFRDGDGDLRRMLQIAKDAALDGESRMHMDFALGKAFNDIGRHERAFDHFTRANRVRREMIDFEIDAHERWVEAIIDAFPDPLPPPGAAEPGPLFIVGMPRSGTTLAEQILASHPDVAAGGELMELRKAVENFWPEYPADAGSAPYRDIAARYADATARFRGKARWLTDKLPENAFRCGVIAHAFPGARIVNCRRDPLDVGLSCYQRLFAGLQPFAYDLEELGRYQVAHNRLMAHWHEVLPGRIHDFDYARVIADQEGESRRLLAFAGLDWRDECLAFHKTRRSVRTASASQVRQPIYRTSLKRWAPYEVQLEPMIRVLREAGELDD